jgi:hypothetical protein
MLTAIKKCGLPHRKQILKMIIRTPTAIASGMANPSDDVIRVEFSV